VVFRRVQGEEELNHVNRRPKAATGPPLPSSPLLAFPSSASSPLRCLLIERVTRSERWSRPRLCSATKHRPASSAPRYTTSRPWHLDCSRRWSSLAPVLTTPFISHPFPVFRCHRLAIVHAPASHDPQSPYTGCIEGLSRHPNSTHIGFKKAPPIPLGDSLAMRIE